MSSKSNQTPSGDIQSNPLHQNRTEVNAETLSYDHEDCLRLAFDNANVGMCLIDLQGHLFRVNQHMCDIFGYSKEEFEGMRVDDFTHPDYLVTRPNYMKQALQGEVIDDEFQKKYIHKKGHIIWGQVSSSLVRDDDGRPVSMSGSLVDISDRKQAEKALLESEKKYRMLLSNLDTGVVVHAPDTRILLSNLRAQELLGLSEADMANRKDVDSYWSFLRKEGTELAVQDYPVNIVRKTLKPLQDYLVGINHPERRTITWAEVNAFPEFDEQGNLRQIIVTFWDVTKRKLAEDALAKRSNDLVKINQELNRQITERKEIEAKLRYRQQLADKELEMAAAIQQTLIPKYSPRIDQIRFAWRFEPCARIGGDIFNFQFAGKDHISFYVFDVCGHGVSSALIASAVSQYLQTSLSIRLPGKKWPRPEAVLNDLERTFPFERFDSFFTIAYVTIDYAKGCLCYASAGHPPPILLGSKGSVRLLDVHGPVIGTGSVQSYFSEKLPLRNGDKVIMYTDGILDYSNAREELFGRQRLLEILRQHADSPVQTLLDKVQESIRDFAGAASPKDDATIIAIEYAGHFSSP